jgi:hypothetical protein
MLNHREKRYDSNQEEEWKEKEEIMLTGNDRSTLTKILNAIYILAW